MRSRCQTFVFQRPRLPELVTLPAPRRRRRGASRRPTRRSRSSRAAPAARSATRCRRSTSSPRRRTARSTRSPCCSCVGAVEEESLLAALRHGRRPRHGRRAALRRGARRSRDRISAGSSPTCSSTCGICCSSSTWATCPDSLPVTEETKRAPARAGEPASASRRCCGSSTCSPSPSRTCARAPTRGCRSSSRS